ncbi:hypothetical protein HOLleu_15271 [Holothuria leucospilota]|uniref:Uncharacterized protein n=1 Tax=Holothuria leucospilota TaxID=206669 RepID=A0A9Q1C9J8_HOLLE|nr:hypothetical protein HOLleu_15271 [Holothuria leucospilota]
MITSKALDSHNCLVVTASQLHQDFLWAQFSLVVEYEFHESPSVWQTICVRQNIRHMGLCIERKSTGEAAVKDENKVVCQADGSSGQYCLKLLCSTKVTENSKLIHYLESRYNIMVLERNYNKILPSFRPPLVYADIIVDVVTGIVLVSSEEVLSLGVEGLTHKVNSLSQQFEVLWLLISIDCESKSILHNKVFRKITCQLYSVFTQYSKTGSQYEVKILFGCTIQELGDAIHMVCNKAEENISSAWHKEDWIKRQCLTAQASKHEVFLMQFPSINAFTAQVLLTSAPLCKLLANYSADVLVTMAPWIPIKFLKIFEEYLKKGHLLMGMTGTLSKTDWVSKDSLLDQSGFETSVATSLPEQHGQVRRLQFDGQAKPSYSDRSHHVNEWNVKEEPSDLVGSDFNLNDEVLSKDYISSSKSSSQQPMTRHYHQRSALDLFAVKEENPNYDSSVRNMQMMDVYETRNYDQPQQCSTVTADSLVTAMPTGSAAMRGQCLPELTAVNTVPYNTSSKLYNWGRFHPSREVTSHNSSDLSHHLHQGVHPNQMAVSNQRSAVLNTNARFSLPPQLGYDREFYPQLGPGLQGEMDPRDLKRQMSGECLSSSLFEEMGQKKRQQPVGGGVQGLAHGEMYILCVMK